MGKGDSASLERLDDDGPRGAGHEEGASMGDGTGGNACPSVFLLFPVHVRALAAPLARDLIHFAVARRSTTTTRRRGMKNPSSHTLIPGSALPDRD